jgi:hypothetical protein
MALRQQHLMHKEEMTLKQFRELSDLDDELRERERQRRIEANDD